MEFCEFPKIPRLGDVREGRRAQAEVGVNKKEGHGMVELGDKVRDMASGFEGIAIGRHEYLYGCVRISIQPRAKKDGSHQDVVVFDEGQLEVIKPSVLKRPASAEVRKGGPRETPTQGSKAERR